MPTFTDRRTWGNTGLNNASILCLVVNCFILFVVVVVVVVVKCLLPLNNIGTGRQWEWEGFSVTLYCMKDTSSQKSVFRT